MKRLVFGLMLIGFGLVTIQHFSKMEAESDDAQAQQVSKEHEEQVLDSNVRKLVNEAMTLDALDKAEAMANSLSQGRQDKLAPMIALKKATFLFEQAEVYLRKAIEIERATSVPPAQTDLANPEQASPPQELHSLTQIKLRKAIELYDKARKLCEGLKDTGDMDFDFHLNYMKGEIYYRFLELVADQESAPEIFNQTLTYYKNALRNRNNDINTVINIEILIKNQNALTGGTQSPEARKKQMLNSKKFGINKSSGN